MEARKLLLSLSVRLHTSQTPAHRSHVALLAGRLGYAAVVAPAGIDASELAHLRECAAPARLLAEGEDDGPGIVRRADPDLVRRARAAVGDAGAVVVDVPVAIGRTQSEAMARAARDSRFAGAARTVASRQMRCLTYTTSPGLRAIDPDCLVRFYSFSSSRSTHFRLPPDQTPTDQHRELNTH